MCLCTSGFNNCLVFRRQRIECLVIDEEVQLRTTLPEAWVVIERCNLVKAQLQVVIRTHPLSCVDGAFFQRWINIATRYVLRYDTQTIQDFSCKAANTEFQTFEIFHRLDFFAEPTTHLGTRIAAWKVNHVVLGIKLTHEFHTITFIHPSSHLTAVQTKRNCSSQSESFVFTKEVVRSCVCNLDRALLDTIHHTESRHDFARRMH